MRYVWRAVRPVPALGVSPGDRLVYDPALADPWVVLRPVTVDPGTVADAERSGALEVMPAAASAPAVRLRLVPRGPGHPSAGRRSSGGPEAA
jgi:hypothetical protein